jgi:hypothetical protein
VFICRDLDRYPSPYILNSGGNKMNPNDRQAGEREIQKYHEGGNRSKTKGDA